MKIKELQLKQVLPRVRGILCCKGEHFHAHRKLKCNVKQFITIVVQGISQTVNANSAL